MVQIKETVSLTKEEMKILLEILGYSVNSSGIVYKSDGAVLECPLSKEGVTLDKSISVMPGSIIVMNTTPVTLSEYFYQYSYDE